MIFVDDDIIKSSDSFLVLCLKNQHNSQKVTFVLKNKTLRENYLLIRENKLSFIPSLDRKYVLWVVEIKHIDGLDKLGII